MINTVIDKYNLEFKLNISVYNKLKNLDILNKNKYKVENNNLGTRIYRYNKRTIIIHSKEKISKSFMNKIDKICNFFDSIFKKEKVFSIDITLDNTPKVISIENPIPCKENVNSASNIIKKGWVVIFRKEEIFKVLVHELIHYFNLHIFTIQKNLLYAFKDINTESVVKPNEGYTEFLALIFYYFIFNNNIVEINKKLTRELAWGFIQSAKILKYKGFDNYQELFSGKEYNQDTSLLSYYILKTYFLFKSSYQKCIKLGPNDDINCFKSINLQDSRFSSIINYCIKNLDVDDKSLKMSLT